MLEKWAMIVLIGFSLFGIGFAKGCQHATKDHDLFVAKMEADSEKLLAQVLQRNTDLKAKYDADAKKKDEDHAKKIAKYAAAVKSGSVFRDSSEGCGSPAPTGKDGTGTPETAASGERVATTPRSVALGEPEVATVLGWYSYAESCNLWSTGK